MKKLLIGVYFGFLALLMAAAMFFYLAPHFGWRADAVGSGSMSPELETGSLVIAAPVAAEAIATGDIIIFQPTTIGENLICHRVIGIEKGLSLQFQTKGDANDAPDPFITPARNLVGKVIFHLSLAGYAAQFLRTVPGFLLGLVMPGLGIISQCARSFRCELVKHQEVQSE